MFISKETPAQIRFRLLKVLAYADMKIYEEEYGFQEFTSNDSPLRANPEALAIIRDGEVWSQLVPSRDASKERFKIFRFYFKEKLDNSGFIGWLGSHLKCKTGTGVFVVCGQNSRQGGIYDYWGCPVEVADRVMAEIQRLREGYKKELGNDILPGPKAGVSKRVA